MNITEMIVELRAEKEEVEQAILVLQRLVLGQGKRRGRPPGSKNKPKNSRA